MQRWQQEETALDTGRDNYVLIGIYWVAYAAVCGTVQKCVPSKLISRHPGSMTPGKVNPQQVSSSGQWQRLKGCRL